MTPLVYFWVAIGGALGSVFRFVLSGMIARIAGEGMPWGTLVVNLLGSFIIGWFAAATASGGRVVATPEFRTFVMVGICGGFTTFSSFSLQTLVLFEDGEPLRASTNVLLSVGLCLAAVWLGASVANGFSSIGKP
ncbi:MAG TPA: fluoride efflux transporter CrcB [Sphingomicrobium sp.]|nr:fluoride efflux transporter CrcB [Sphingomicrobium sp.]